MAAVCCSISIRLYVTLLYSTLVPLLPACLPDKPFLCSAAKRVLYFSLSTQYIYLYLFVYILLNTTPPRTRWDWTPQERPPRTDTPPQIVILYSASSVELLGQHVRDVVPRVTVQALLQTLLVHVVADEADAAPQHKQRVDRSDVDVLLGLLTEKE